MESKRQHKFARLIQKELGDIFQRDSKSLFGNTWITVTSVQVTPDLGLARVHLSFLMAENKEQILADIQEKTKSIRQVLGSRIRHQVRIIPELTFFLDNSAEYAARMDALIGGLNIPPPAPDDTLGEEE